MIFVFSMVDNKLSPPYSKRLDPLQFGYIFIIFTRTDLVYLQQQKGMWHPGLLQSKDPKNSILPKKLCLQHPLCEQIVQTFRH